MAKCTFCGQSAGLFRSSHKECRAKHDAGWSRMVTLVEDSVRGDAAADALEAQLTEIASSSYIPDTRVREAIILGWQRSVEHFLNDGHLDESEENQLCQFAADLSLSQDDLDSKGAHSRMVKGAILRDVMNGTVPERLHVSVDLPFRFQKSEKLIWVFPNVSYYEDRKRRKFAGGSQAVSFRIAKGVYYRLGAFKGQPVETTETVFVGSGPMAITNKHVYFAGGNKSFRIQHEKIVTIQPYEDGVGLQRDAQTARPQLFINGDGWFTYNLLMNISNL